MKKLFSHENRIIVFNLRNVLEGEGINSHVVNEFAAGGAGDLPTFDTWPELWIDDESQFERARAIIDKILSDERRDEWFCRACGEKIDAAFHICWSCGQAREAEESS